LSIPVHFDFIPDAPYLHALPERMEKWKQSIPHEGKRKIGLAWKGNPLHENDDRRSLPSLSLFQPFAELENIAWVSLQKNSTEARFPPFPLVNLGEKTADFADTAAIVSMLDLVISVDTSVVHLAGALGKPCWVLLPSFKTDWRWLKERTDSPWYPSVRLFRQKHDDDWKSVVEEIREALLP
ncbi:MAG TPA: glycosyltransferase family 9 protein, partial [Burkholderiales bacterium]|nr:glycosyltransferase family 9 protein [Burkholderiales bacterium]